LRKADQRILEAHNCPNILDTLAIASALSVWFVILRYFSSAALQGQHVYYPRICFDRELLTGSAATLVADAPLSRRLRRVARAK